MGSISVGHVGQTQPVGSSRAGPGEEAHTGGSLNPTAKYEEEEEEITTTRVRRRQQCG